VRNITSIFFIIAILCAAFTGCVKNNKTGLTITDGILSVGVEIGYPPMEYYGADGVTLRGFDIELTKALADKLGLSVKYIDTSWEGIFAGLDTEKYDIAVNITILPERQKNYNFTKPYISSSITYVALKNYYIPFDKPELIAGRNAGYQGNTTAQYFAEKILEQGLKFASFSYDKIINCFDDLYLKRIDLAVVDNIAAYHYLNKENSPFEIIWEGPSNEHIAICLKKGNDELTSAIDNALDELFKDGAIQEISMQIFKTDMVSSAWKQKEFQ